MSFKSRRALAVCILAGWASMHGVAALAADGASDLEKAQKLLQDVRDLMGGDDDAKPSGDNKAKPADKAKPAEANAKAAADSVIRPSGEPVKATVSASGQASPGKKINSGVSGQAQYGFNIHPFIYSWVGPMFQQTGAKVIRINSFYGLYAKTGVYPGKNNANAITQATVDSAVAAGMDVVLLLSGFPYDVNDPTMKQWPGYVEAIAAANPKNVIFELGNEPDTRKVSAQQYFDLMKATYPALKKGNPSAQMAAPVINASFTGEKKKFISQLVAMPGVFDLFDWGDFHPYYHTPEKSYSADVNAFIESVDTPATKAGKSLEFVASEVGWSNATGLLPAKGLDQSFVLTADGVADYYSRYIPITRATRKLRKVIFYSLMDEGPPDPNMTNVQAHFGIFTNGGKTAKPASSVAKDLFAHVHAATGADLFTRSGTSGQEDTTADWFVRLDTPQNPELIAWTAVTAGRTAQIAVDAKQAGTLSVKAAGVAATEVALKQGQQFISVPLSGRSVILSSSVPIAFPEFK